MIFDKDFVALVGKLSAASAIVIIAVYLVFQNTKYLPAIQDLQQQNINMHIEMKAEYDQKDARYSEIIELFGKQQTIMLYLMKEICISNAKDTAGRARCNPRPDSDLWNSLSPP